MLHLTVQSPCLSSRALAQQWQQTSGVQARPRTVRHRLFTSGLYSYVAPKRPLLTQRHKRARLQWTNDYVDWTVNDWQPVLFVDETPLQLVQTNQRRYYRSRRGAGRVTNIISPRF